MSQPVSETAIEERPYRAVCPVCGQEVWAGLNPPPDSDDVYAGHDCSGPLSEKSSAATEAETVTPETEAVHAEIVEQVQPGPVPGELAPPLG